MLMATKRWLRTPGLRGPTTAPVARSCHIFRITDQEARWKVDRSTNEPLVSLARGRDDGRWGGASHVVGAWDGVDVVCAASVRCGRCGRYLASTPGPR